MKKKRKIEKYSKLSRSAYQLTKQSFKKPTPIFFYPFAFNALNNSLNSPFRIPPTFSSSALSFPGIFRSSRASGYFFSVFCFFFFLQKKAFVCLKFGAQFSRMVAGFYNCGYKSNRKARSH